MDTIVIHPKNKEQSAAIKAFARVLKGKIADIKKIEIIFAEL